MGRTKPAPAKKLKKPTVASIALELIDPSPAFAVRAEQDRETINKYMLIDDLPPVDVFEGGGKLFLGDGGHRYVARQENGDKKISCRVHKCKSEIDALARARVHAAGSNETHGLPRSAADKRVAVKSIIALEAYAELTDNKIAYICRVGHVIVRLVREELTAAGVLTGPAASTARNYKADAKLRGGTQSDGKGNLVARQQTEVNDNGNQGEGLPQTDVASVPSKEDTTIPGISEENTTGKLHHDDIHEGRETANDRPGIGNDNSQSSARVNEDVTTHDIDIPKEVFRDHRSRIIPDNLVFLFNAGKDFAQNAKEVLAEVYDSIVVASSEDWGKALQGVLNPTEVEIRNIRESIDGAVPYAVCPAVGEDGQHKKDKCKVCLGRCYITKHIFRQLTPDLKKACGGNPEVE